MVEVEKVIHRNPVYIQSNSSVLDAVKLMKKRGVGSLLIKNGKELVGILTETDMTHKVVMGFQNPRQLKIKEIMSSPLISIQAHQSVVDAGKMMESFHVQHLVVEKRDKVIGIVSTRDLVLPLEYFENLSIHDGLTGLLNRKAFSRHLKDEITRSLRFERNFSLLMLDIDHFKKINDTHGHPTGDKVLKKISALLRSEMRSVDQVSRYGGEEFAILLPETSRPNAETKAEKIRKKFSSKKLRLNKDLELELTVSIGIAVYPKDGKSVQGLIAKADQALYQAKRSGRNRVC